MSKALPKRSRLLAGCAGAALALALPVGGEAPARAQGIQANGTVTFGTAQINQTGPNQTTISVSGPTTVIDWRPDVLNGNALDFLPTGSSALFRNNPTAQVPANFAVLNRILPAPNGNAAVINGNVISQFFDGNGFPSASGFIAFYSPTGILAGSTARFDVGQLMLTTLDPTQGSFDGFAQSGLGLRLVGAQGSTARISVAPGAQILATPENAFFALVAADVEMRGTARINGSHVYVAAQEVNLDFDNGLFSIMVPVGTAAAGAVLTLDGTIGGPSSTGAADNHMIYAVARAATDPIAMLLRGNLGFDPALAAGVVNGEIILSANFDVNGRLVEGGSVRDGVNAAFQQKSPTTARADIDIVDAGVSSSLLAIGSHRVTAAATGANSAYAANLLLVGRERAELLATGGRTLTIAGDVLVDSRDFGVTGVLRQQTGISDGVGGTALIEASGGSAITVSGEARVLADAFAGGEIIQGVAGAARGGTATISGNGGTVDISGPASVSARGVGSNLINIVTGAESRGGTAELRVRSGGTVTIRQSLAVLADAVGAQGTLQTASSVSHAFGGIARIALLGGGGAISVQGSALVDASAVGGAGNTTGAGAIGDAGEATVSTLDSGRIAVGGVLRIAANGLGGINAGGTGGVGLGGRASALTEAGGVIDVTGDFFANAGGTGGIGQVGGNGAGGIAGAIARIGRIGIGGGANVNASGFGGTVDFGFGGAGGAGRGGSALLQAEGTLAQTASLAVTGAGIVLAEGTGGNGGISDGASIAAGRGGDAFGGEATVPNQADPAFASGAFVLAGSDNGTITIGGLLTASSNAFAGSGGNGDGAFLGGPGGNAFGGRTQIGLALFGQNGALGAGRASFGDVIATADGIGASSGLTAPIIPSGAGGNGTGGTAQLSLRAGQVTAGVISLQANGTGGLGNLAGTGSGGRATVVGTLGARLTANGLLAQANGLGGLSETANGGAGIGGAAEVALTGTTITLAAGAQAGPANLSVRADGSGGFGGPGGTIGSGRGGQASLSLTGGSLTTTDLLVSAQGSALGPTGQIGGAANGGLAALVLGGAATISAITATVTSSAATGAGGTAQGGLATLDIATGSTAALTAADLFVFADASGADPADLANGAGSFAVNARGGNFNLGRLTASAIGNRLPPGPLASQLLAEGGNINVTGDLTGTTFGDVLVRHGAGGIIGSTGTGPTATAVQLDARGTVTLASDGGASGGLGGRTINLLAGRTILLGGNIAAAGGLVSLTANRGGGAPLALPPVSVIGLPPVSVIAMAPGSRINAGTGTVTLRLLDGAGDPQRANGAITLANITARRIDARNFGTGAGSNIEVRAGSVLTASGTGRAIDLAALNGEVLNLAGDPGLVLTGGGHYGIFAATPTGSQIGSLANYARRYNVLTATAYDALNPGGNFAAFRVTPVLTVTANTASRFYGSANPAFSANIAGFFPGDSVADLVGALQFLTGANGTSPVGQYALGVAQGTLASPQGYQFAFAPGVLNVTARPITITAGNFSRIYGNANPALTFTVGGQGLVNGDQLSGALASTAGLTTGVGSYAITQGTLAASANYVLSFVGGQLTITPRPITITADNLSKILGLTDPPLTFTLGGLGLVNGDQLTGALARDPGERIATFAIRQGTLTASANYALTFVPGTLTINAPPTPQGINNPISFAPPLVIAATAPPIAGQEGQRFGSDFPEQPEAPLISEDPLLDDPVASGSDSALYGGGATSPEGER
jgi:hypothetical protein